MSKSDKKKEKKEKDPAIKLLDIVIIVLIFVTLYVGQSAAFYKSRADKKSFSQDAGMMSFELQEGDYAAFIQGKYINEFNGNMEPAGYHSLADYIEAASMYKIYNVRGYTDKADKQRAVMDKARAEMGELTVFADKADKMFGLSYK